MFFPKAEILLSIVIPTFQRPQLLEQCLLSLKGAAIEVPEISMELAVLINGNDSESEMVFQRFAKEASTFTNLIFKKSCHKLTPSEARNLLVAESHGEWVFFIDDDAKAYENLFKTFQALKNKFPKATVFGGPNLNPPNSNLFQKASSLALASPLAAWTSSVRYKKGGSGLTCGEESLILCNLFVHRKILGKNPFPSQFVCCEENWFLQERKREGNLFIYDSELYVWHERRSRPSDFISQVFKYGYGRGQFLRGGKSNRFYYWVPVIFSLYLLSLVPAFIFSHSTECLFPLGIYFACVLISLLENLLHRESIFAIVLSAIIYPLIHLAYGSGLVTGYIQAPFRIPNSQCIEIKSWF